MRIVLTGLSERGHRTNSLARTRPSAAWQVEKQPRTNSGSVTENGGPAELRKSYMLVRGSGGARQEDDAIYAPKMTIDSITRTIAQPPTKGWHTRALAQPALRHLGQLVESVPAGRVDYSQILSGLFVGSHPGPSAMSNGSAGPAGVTLSGHRADL